MTSPAHPSLRTFPRLQLSSLLPTTFFFLSLSLSLSLSPVNCASILIRQLPSFYPNSLALFSLCVLSLSAISSSLLFSPHSYYYHLVLLTHCIFPSLRLAIGGRVFPSSHNSFPPSIHPSLLLLCDSPLAVSYKPLFCLFASVVVSFSSFSSALSLSLSPSPCCCCSIVGASSSCIVST